jgi:hypothetical protein
MNLSSYFESGTLVIVFENFNTFLTSHNKNESNNFSISFVIDNCTMESKLGEFEIDMRFHIPNYDSITNMPNYYLVSTFDLVIDNIVET